MNYEQLKRANEIQDEIRNIQILKAQIPVSKFRIGNVIGLNYDSDTSRKKDFIAYSEDNKHSIVLPNINKWFFDKQNEFISMLNAQ